MNSTFDTDAANCPAFWVIPALLQPLGLHPRPNMHTFQPISCTLQLLLLLLLWLLLTGRRYSPCCC